ncbi:unnamed protein product [Camellia sinensis]
MANNSNPSRPLFCKKVAFPALEYLEIWYVKNEYFWQLRNLPCLRDLFVFGCSKLKAIVVANKEGGAHNKPLVFGELRFLRPFGLNNLKSVYNNCGPEEKKRKKNFQNHNPSLVKSDEAVQPSYDEEYMEESSDHGQDYDQDVRIFDVGDSIFSGKDYDQTEGCDQDVPIFDAEQVYDENISIFDEPMSGVFDYDEIKVNEYEKKVDVYAYVGAPIFDNYDDEDDLLVDSEGVLEDEKNFVDKASFALTLLPMRGMGFVNETSFALTLLPMKEMVAIPPIPFLDSTKIMEKSHDIKVSWVLNDLCFREMHLILSSKTFVPLCVNLVPGLASWRKDAFILGSCEKRYFDDILFPKRVAFPALEDLEINDVRNISGITGDKQLKLPVQQEENESFWQLRNLPHLRHLRIAKCSRLKAIVLVNKKEGAHDKPLIFCELRSLDLSKLWNLKSFYDICGSKAEEEILEPQPFFNEKV